MQVQLQVQPCIHCSGHLCTPGRKQQEEETHQEGARIKKVAAPVNGVIKVDIRQEEALGQEEQDHLHQEEGPGGGSLTPGGTPPQQSGGGAGNPGSAPPTPPGIAQPPRSSDPWSPLDRSRKALPKLMLPSNYKACNLLEMRQLLESWYDRCTFAVATWRGDAQRYWLDQILDHARTRHDQWLPSTPSQRASLEPAYISGDRKNIPEAQNAVVSVLRTELLDAIPKSIAEACMRHGYCHNRAYSVVCDEAAHHAS